GAAGDFHAAGDLACGDGLATYAPASVLLADRFVTDKAMGMCLGQVPFPAGPNKANTSLFSQVKVGIGTITPTYSLDVVGSGAAVIKGTNSIASNGSAAVFGEETSTSAVTIGVYGNCFSDQGRGVFGASRNTSGPGIGVYGYSEGDSG